MPGQSNESRNQCESNAHVLACNAQVVQCIHGLAAPQLQAQLARMPAALQMGAKERAVYLGRKVLRGVKAYRCSSVCVQMPCWLRRSRNLTLCLWVLAIAAPRCVDGELQMQGTIEPRLTQLSTQSVRCRQPGSRHNCGSGGGHE